MNGDTLQFGGLVAAVSVIALGVLVVPLVRRRSSVSAMREIYDINVYKDQLDEVDREIDRGLMDDVQAEAAKIEIKRRMLDAAEGAENSKGKKNADVPPSGPMANLGLISVIVLALPAAALVLYLNLGRPGTPDQPFAERQVETRIAGKAGRSNLTSIVEQLAKRLKSAPDDLRGWMLLGQSYMSLSRYSDAAGAYERAYGVSGEEAEIGAEYAEALSLAANSTVTPLAKDIFEKTLAADTLNAKARFYLAMYKAQGGDFPGALQGWVDLAAISPADAPWFGVLSQQIVWAGQQSGIDPTTIQPSPEMAALATEARKGHPQKTPAPETESQAPGPSRADVKAASKMTGEERMAVIHSMVNRLADQLKDKPDDKAGWIRLERAYRVLGESAKADQAAARATELP